MVLVISLFACSECHVVVIVLCLFLTVPWVGLKYVFVAFPGHTHLLLIPQYLVELKYAVMLHKPEKQGKSDRARYESLLLKSMRVIPVNYRLLL